MCKFNARFLGIAFSFVAVLFVFAVDAAAQKYSRIRFAKGTDSKIVAGTLNGYNDKKIFKVRVGSGQTISYEQIARDDDNAVITILISDPHGRNVNDMDASCNNRAEISPTADGDYTLEVFQCKKADEWSGDFRFRITVR